MSLPPGGPHDAAARTLDEPTPAVATTVAFERRVLDALPLTIWSTDRDGRITSTNRSWDRFAIENGAAELADADRLIGRSIWDAIADPASRERVQRAMQLLATGRTDRVSWEFPCSSPVEERVFLMQVTAMRDPDDHAVQGFVFSTVDITPSHESREVLVDGGIALARTIDLDRLYAEVARQVRRAIRSEAVCLAIVDDDTAALEVRYATGYDESPARLAARLSPTWLDALANGRVVVSGMGAGLELTAPMTSAEGALGVITAWTDGETSPEDLDTAQRLFASLAAQTAAAIDRAWLVRRVEQKRRLEAIGELAAGVAHELRNPLFGISSAAQLLRFRSREDPVVEKNVGRILREVDRLNRMVTSLLEYGRPAAIRPVPGDPDAVWDDVLEGQRGLLASRGLTVQRARPHTAARCSLDEEQLAQVFLNVLVNACDAAPRGTTITLQSAVLSSGAWRFRITNGGPAIPPEVLPRVFEIFYSTKPGGTGIGLALCQRIVEEHGGTIGIESVPETGTTVTIVLPPLGAT